MGEAKRRGSFNKRKALRISMQYGLTNQQLNDAYNMNRRYNYNKMIGRQVEIYDFLSAIMQSFRPNM